LAKIPDADARRRLREQSDGLRAIYAHLGSEATIADVFFDRYKGLPPLGECTHNNSLGTACMVLTRDEQVMFVQRGGNVSVNKGVNCTASGAATFDRATLEAHGFGAFLGNEMDREVRGELGLSVGSIAAGSMRWRIARELGLCKEDYEIVPVGLIREIPRGGKPEVMFLVRTSLTADEVAARIQANTNAEKQELEKSLLALALPDIVEMFRDRTIHRFVQHKGVANLALALDALKI
jgi:hypothetical protein